MHIGSYEKMQAFADKWLPTKNYQVPYRILEVGSRNVNGTYKPIFDRPELGWEYTGLDMEAGDNVDVVIKDPYKWNEIPSKTFDAVISGSLLEHVEYPWLTMLEVNRVLKDGGLTCHIAPSGGFEHRFPVDCYRYYPDGFKALLKWGGFKELEVYTDWDSSSSQDGGHVWHDSVMVGIKNSDERLETKMELLTFLSKVLYDRS